MYALTRPPVEPFGKPAFRSFTATLGRIKFESTERIVRPCFAYNTMSRNGNFSSRSADAVRLYLRPTVYNYAHIGNFPYVFEDILRRVLQYLNHKVIRS